MAEGISVQIDAAAVERQVTEAIIASSLGEQIQKAVDDVFKKGTYGGPTPLQTAVTSQVQESVRFAVLKEIREGEAGKRLRAAVQEALNDEVIAEIAKKIVWQLAGIRAEDLGLHRDQ